MEMRAVFAQTLEQLMSKNDNIVVLDADLARANGTLALHSKYPHRTVDVGVAEQNMASVAAGLASYGFIPFISSFTPFASRRIADQIAISICYAGSNVKVVGSDPGISAELNGGTHMSVEDIGVLRSIPNLVIVEPADSVSMKKAVEQIAEYKGAVYMRLFRKEAPDIYSEEDAFDLFKANILIEGSDVTIAASGIMVIEAIEAAALLKEQGISAEVIDFHTIKPLDTQTLLGSVKKTGCIVTAENHNIIGGLRSAVAECLIENEQVPLRSVGMRDCFGQVGRLPELKAEYGLTAEEIVNKAKKVLEEKSR